MAIRLSEQTLEERMKDIPMDVTLKLQDAISERKERNVVPPYFDYELVERIVHYFDNKKIRFGDNTYEDARKYLNGSINKEPLKAVYRGMTKVKGIPAEFLDRLDDFEKIYFFAGIDKVASAPLMFLAMTPDEIASIYIPEGIKHMEMMHNSIVADSNVHKRNVYRGNRKETYQSEWTAPHKEKVIGELHTREQVYQALPQRYSKIVEEFRPLIQEEEEIKKTDAGLFTLSEQEKKDELNRINEDISRRLSYLDRQALAYLEFAFPGKTGYFNPSLPIPEKK